MLSSFSFAVFANLSISLPLPYLCLQVPFASAVIIALKLILFLLLRLTTFGCLALALLRYILQFFFRTTLVSHSIPSAFSPSKGKYFSIVRGKLFGFRCEPILLSNAIKRVCLHFSFSILCHAWHLIKYSHQGIS